VRNMSQHPALARAAAFCEQFNLRVPILMAPMASACPASLAIAIANAGGLGGCGALNMQPEAIRKWAADVRAGTNGGFQFNLWIPDPPPKRDAAAEAAVRDFLADWGPPVPAEAGNVVLPDFQAQCDAILDASPAIVSSIMGFYPDRVVARMKAKGIKWFATVTTVAEAKVAERAGADAVIAQGMEAGGHRGTSDLSQAETRIVGLFSLVSGVADAVNIPVVATGGIADGRGIAAALLLGASAVQIGTAFLRCPEAKIPSAWADAIGKTAPEDTIITRTVTGRPARSIATEYVRAATAPAAPPPAPYPIQRGLTQPMREAAAKANDVGRMQAWAGQSARLARAEPAGEVVQRLWRETQVLLG
jgi:nitronate monooxygenase